MKRVVSILLVAVMLLSVSAFALEERVQTMMIDLSFNGTTATCEVSAYASNMNQEVSAVIKLYHGKTCLHTWNVSDYGYIEFSDTWRVNSGYTYKLTADVTINGTTYATIEDSGQCP